MEFCRKCAAPLRITRALANQTEIPSSLMLNSIRTLTTNQSRRNLYQLQAQHRHGQTHQTDDRDAVEHDHRRHEENDVDKSHRQPKSFKELVAMQQRARQSQHRPDDHPIVSRDDEKSSDDLVKLTAVENDAQHSLKTPPKVRQFFEPVVGVVANIYRKSDEKEKKFWRDLEEELPEMKLNQIKRFTKQSQQLQESNLVMYATTKAMFFHGHPFRGAVLLTSFWPCALAELLKDVLPQHMPEVALFGTVVFYWAFLLTKLTRAVWYDPKTDLFLIYMPFRRTTTMSFKAGQITEIDDLLANVSIRGIKAYCPKDFFFRDDDFEKMLKRKTVTNHGSSQR